MSIKNNNISFHGEDQEKIETLQTVFKRAGIIDQNFSQNVGQLGGLRLQGVGGESPEVQRVHRVDHKDPVPHDQHDGLDGLQEVVPGVHGRRRG